MKKKILTIALAVFVGSTAASVAVNAQDRTGTNMGEKPSGAQVSMSAQSAERLQLAYAAAKYARQTKSADGLILAARILKETPADKLAGAKTSEGGMASTGEAKTNMGAMTAESLIADARSLPAAIKRQ